MAKESKAGSYLNFIELSQPHAEKIVDYESANEMRIKTRSHFCIYGNVRKRPINGQEHQVIELNGIVTHKEVPKEISEKFSKEFTELFPTEINFPAGNELIAFKFTSDWAAIVAKYIIGIAATLSGDLGYSELSYIIKETETC